MSFFAVLMAIVVYVLFGLARYRQHLQRQRGEDC